MPFSPPSSSSYRSYKVPFTTMKSKESMRAAAWRGLSIDLIHSSESHHFTWRKYVNEITSSILCVFLCILLQALVLLRGCWCRSMAVLQSFYLLSLIIMLEKKWIINVTLAISKAILIPINIVTHKALLYCFLLALLERKLKLMFYFEYDATSVWRGWLAKDMSSINNLQRLHQPQHLRRGGGSPSLQTSSFQPVVTCMGRQMWNIQTWQFRQAKYCGHYAFCHRFHFF